jgi:hypothetical protein
MQSLNRQGSSKEWEWLNQGTGQWNSTAGQATTTGASHIVLELWPLDIIWC